VNALRRIRPALAAVTPLGWIVLGGSVTVWVAGTVAGWAEAVLAGLTGVLTFALCALFSLGRTAIAVRIEPRQRRILAGATTTVDVAVTSTAPRRLLGFALEVGAGPGVELFAVPGLAAGAGFTADFPVEARRRGVIAVGPATSVRGDPLGLLQRRVVWTGPTEIFVHPVTVRLEAVGQGLLRDLEGRTTNEISMSDLDFHALREYVPGDDRRYIHWRSSAKAAKADAFLVRQFRDTRRTHLLIVIDGDAAAYADPDEFETAVSAGASIACRAVEDGVDVSLFAAGRWTGRGTAGRTRQAVLDTCARAETGGEPLALQTGRAAQAVPEASFAVLVTGARPAFTELRRAAARLPVGLPSAIVRVDPPGRPRYAPHPALTVLTVTDLTDLRGLLALARRTVEVAG
jgi:uncharacterized protein (DUF58 family)